MGCLYCHVLLMEGKKQIRMGNFKKKEKLKCSLVRIEFDEHESSPCVTAVFVHMVSQNLCWWIHEAK